MNFRFCFVVFCLTCLLLGAVYLRNANNRLFYDICVAGDQQSRLKQSLWQKQMQLENLTNPSAIWELIEPDRDKE